MLNQLSKIARLFQYTVPVAGTLWLTLHTVQPPAASQKVIVVGAGASGIAAASHLKNAGFDVTVLEARNRIGGRIWTDYKLAKHPVELGAEFIHGSEVLTWKLLKQYNLKAKKPIRDKQLYAHLKNTVEKFDDLIPEDWEDDIWECAEEWVDEGEPDTTLRKMLDFEKWLMPHDSELARLMNNLYACDYGADLSELGMYGVLEASYRGDADEDGDYPLEKGYTALIEKMAKGLDIRLNTAVQSVNYTAPTVTITDKDGNTYSADRVIITLPLAILQSGDVEFIPAFPKHKLKAIHGIGSGKVNKVILGFKHAFWKKKMAMLLTPLDTQIWWRPGYDPDNGDTVLTALIGGESGTRYSQLSEAEAVDLALKDLQQIFGNEAKKAFKWGCFINWGADPYSKMGYSYNPVGVAGLRQALSENIADRVYFAGEATNTIRPATVHGAIESGWRAAKEIIASASKDK